ncbi:MAG: hypothetical protein DSY87_04675 [Methylococcus sp.]|jgi:hypothetical protein|nr:MAG: hypothetical protein DSY87_04675 [Methylococcus sp.]
MNEPPDNNKVIQTLNKLNNDYQYIREAMFEYIERLSPSERESVTEGLTHEVMREMWKSSIKDYEDDGVET